jgi:hypothetical protein
VNVNIGDRVAFLVYFYGKYWRSLTPTYRCEPLGEGWLGLSGKWGCREGRVVSIYPETNEINVIDRRGHIYRMKVRSPWRSTARR